MSEAWREETGKLHTRINEVKEDVARCRTDIATNGVKLDTLIKVNGKGGAITRGQLILAAAIITAMFGLIEAVIAMVQ